MASSREVYPQDLPPEFGGASEVTSSQNTRWERALADWAEDALRRGETEILQHALPEFERIMIEAALAHTGGRKREASELLGWGRNTLTRKLAELNLVIH